MRSKLWTVRILCACGCFLISANAAWASAGDFQKLYDFYFPKKDGGVLSSIYRPSFDKELFGPPPKAGEERHPEFYYAFHGDAVALHRFFHSSDRDGEGEFGEAWAYECLVLLLKLGDDKFSQLLAKEDSATREAVGKVIDSLVNWSKHDFPKTRALYSYRYVPFTQRDREQRNREPLAVAWKGISEDQWKKLQSALEHEKRFSNVQLTTTQDGITSITIPKSMPERDRVDLKRVIELELKRTKDVQYYH